MTRPRVREDIAALLIASLVLLLGPASAWPHAALVKSVPARRAVLARPPERVQLWFNERLETQFARLSVWDGSGAQVDLGDAQVDPTDPKKLSVGVRPLSPGVHTIRFRVLSVDGHVVEGELPFTLKASP